MTIPKLVTTVYVVMFTLFILPQDVIAICLPTTVSTFSNELEATVCPGDGEEDLVKFKPSTWATAYRFIVTDENNVIVDWFSGNNFDFEDLGSGIFRVYGLSYSGVLNIPIGQNVLTTDFGSFCWILSDNYVLINSVITVGGIVITQDGDMVAYTCPDGNSNILSFANAFALGNNYAYFITDANGLIFGISEDENFDFEGLPNGTYIVHGVAYVGNLTAEIGDNVNTTNLSDGCYDLSSLTVEVFKDVPEGGTVSLLDGGDFIEICVGDGQPSFVGYTHQNSSNSLYGYLITDENDNILAVQLDSIQDFADAGMGVCHIYGVAYTGNFTTTDGENIFTADITDDCFSISTNFITVQRNQVDGGNVTTSTGENLIYLCPNDNNSSGNGMTDIVEFERTDASNSPYAYLIVDENNIVLAIETGDAYDFENASLGECFVIGVAYTGNITIQSGDDASVVVFSDDCYSFSDNLITVKRINPEGGILQFTGVDSTSTLCAGDVNPDIISIANVDAAIGPYIFIITDENDVIVGNTPAFNIDFDIFSEAACRIYGVSFTGNYQGMLGDTLPNIALSTDCFDISDNFLTVEKNYVNAGNLTTINAETSVIICPNDGVPNVIEFATDTDAQISNYQYIITNNQGEILALPAGNSFDFEPAGIGICKVYAISYTGNLVAEIDSSITTVMSTECYDLSDNFIEVLRDEPNGNIIASDLGDVVDFCVNDGEADVINFLTGSFSFAAYAYILTDENNVIVSFESNDFYDLDSLPAGVCRVWGISYTGNILAGEGDELANDTLSDDCWDVSDNFITINRFEVDGATIFTPNNATEIYTCPDDGNADFVGLFNTSTLGDYKYIITNDTNEVVDVVSFNLYDFEDLPEGTCRIYGMSHTGIVEVEVGDDLFSTVLTDGCFDISDNFLTVIKVNPEGGMITTEDGETQQTIFIDGIADTLNFVNNGSPTAKQRYVITDENEIILGITEDNFVDFENADVGVCHVYNLVYTGELMAEEGDVFQEVSPASDCWAVSDNFVTVTRLEMGSNLSQNVSLGTTVSTIESLELSPNPARDFITIKLNSNTESQGQIQITDLSGKFLFNEKNNFEKGMNTIEIPVANWQNGLYLVTIQNGKEFLHEKFVKD